MSLDPHTLRTLRATMSHAKKGRTSLSGLLDVQQSLANGASVTIDFRAEAELGHPMLILETPSAAHAEVATRYPAWWGELSSREQEVARLLTEGASNRDIAGCLFIALSTVKDHVHSILQKSACARRGQVAHALRSVT